MDTLNLEKTMKEIVNIDNEAIELQKMFDDVKIEYEKILKKEIHNLENHVIRESKKKGKRYLKEMEELMDDEEQKIRDVSFQECEDLDALFFHNKIELVNKAFNVIVLEEEV